MVGDAKYASHRKLNQTEIPNDDIEMIEKIRNSKFMTEKDANDIKHKQRDMQLNNESRNRVEEYWKVKPISIDQKTREMYKSSENLQTEQFMPQDQFKKQQHDIFKKYVDDKVEE